jgi:Na+/H+ antiporter NhaD/arsenite permease-like protein
MVVRDIEALQKDPLHARLTRIGLIGFGSAVVLLIFHHALAELTHLPINAAIAALAPAGVALLCLSKRDRRTILLKLVKDDVESLVFFAGLFVLIGGLEKVEVFGRMAEMMAAATTGSPQSLVMALHWGPGLLSGILDNVPLIWAATSRPLGRRPTWWHIR